MSDLQDAIARTSIKAFNSGYAEGYNIGEANERKRIVELLQTLRNEAQDSGRSQTANINAVITLIAGKNRRVEPVKTVL